MSCRLSYQVVTAARDEAENLPRLAKSLASQTALPERWTVVDNGSIDGTATLVRRLAAEHGWVRFAAVPETASLERGAPIVRAIHAALSDVDEAPDVFVNVDADVSMEPDYFERLLAHFDADPRLGIASGSAWEQESGTWRQRFVTGGTVWGATRAYRWACLQEILPLRARHGWDGIDQLQARARNWTTLVDTDLAFFHHRREGARDGSRWDHWRLNGDTAHFMGYRPAYLLGRVAHNVWRDPAAIAMFAGFLFAALKREPRLDDAAARRVLAQDQSISQLRRRWLEARGRSRRRSRAARPQPVPRQAESARRPGAE